MRLVGAENINVTALKALHTGTGNKGALSFDDPGNLCFVMPVQVVVKMRLDVFLHHYRMFLRYRNGKLNDFHDQLDWLVNWNVSKGQESVLHLTNITKLLSDSHLAG
jgi:hypothetical protein